MKELLLSLLAGLIVGAIFTIIRLPIPAPPVLPGVLGIVGVYAGAKIMETFMKWFGN